LQKRSSKKPGAVLKMLVDHAKTTLDQSSVVETEKDQQVTGGIKISTYFNLLVRPYHSPASRVMKEMNHVAVCLDELRSGQLGRLGDSLSSRRKGAPTSLLEPKRHGRLVQKSQGKEPWRPKGEGDPWRSSGKGGDGSYLKAPLSLLIDSRVYNRL